MKRYRVKVNGLMTTLRLSDADAAARGLLAMPAEVPVVEPVEDDGTDIKARKPANKSRRPANKRREAAAMAFVAKTGDE